MAEALKVLAQIDVPNSMTTLYTVPAATQVTTSSIVVCNRTVSTHTFRMAVIKSGDSLANKCYIYYDLQLTKNNTFTATLGMTLAAGDFIQVMADAAASLSISIFGVEVT